jgi:taurine dioxygenase
MNIVRPESTPRVRRLTGTLGAEISGVRMAGASADAVELIRSAALTHKVVAVRDQFLAPKDLMDFGNAFGGPFIHPQGVPSNHELPALLVLQSGTAANARAATWHTDATTSDRPPSFSILASQVLPEAGGDTLFVDMAYAYRTLSAPYKRLLRGLRAHHVNRQLSTGVFENWHPIVRTIPETGGRVLYPGFPNVCSEIDGLTVAESRRILEFLYTQATRPDAMYRHRWLPGDVLIWDNRQTLHYAVQDYGDAERTMVRLMVEGERPYEAPYQDNEP